MSKDEQIVKMLKEQKAFLEEKLNDYISSIREIKGNEYAEAIRFLSGVSHAGKMISVATKDAPEIIRQAVGMQFASACAIGSALICDLMKMSKEDMEEMMKWSDIISNSIDETLQSVHNKVRSIQDDDSDS